MTAAAAALARRPRRWRRGRGWAWWRSRANGRNLRLGAGLLLFVFVATHLLNHSLGLISLDAMEAGRKVFVAVWRAPVVSELLLAALAFHAVLALWAVYRRRTLRSMPGWEVVQLVLGLAIVPLLAEHVIGTRIVHERFGTEDNYTYVVAVLWVAAPEAGLRQLFALLAVWLHGCIGLHRWLRLKPWYPRVVVYAYAGALLLPVLALLGFVGAGKEVALLLQDEAWRELAFLDINPPDAEAAAWAKSVTRVVQLSALAAVAATFAARAVRLRVERRRGLLRIAYGGGSTIQVPRGLTILEASRAYGVPHASVCGGRGRCSTCRVRVDAGAEALAPPDAAEQRVLARINAPPNVRLACQARPSGDVAVTPLLPPTARARDGHRRPDYLRGSEREIAILFADLRAFTQLSESKLPYDVVFLLNRYFSAMGIAVEAAGGRIDKFIGDGVMALFGIDSGAERGARQALTAARDMAARLNELNQALAHDLEAPLRIGIGIHIGACVVGEMGYSHAVSVTAIGDAVNTASRLEALTKDFDAQLVFSDALAQRAGLATEGFAREEVPIRGRNAPLAVWVVRDALELPRAL
jgi:adenylate cyclase